MKMISFPQSKYLWMGIKLKFPEYIIHLTILKPNI